MNFSISGIHMNVGEALTNHAKQAIKKILDQKELSQALI